MQGQFLQFWLLWNHGEIPVETQFFQGGEVFEKMQVKVGDFIFGMTTSNRKASWDDQCFQLLEFVGNLWPILDRFLELCLWKLKHLNVRNEIQ